MVSHSGGCCQQFIVGGKSKRPQPERTRTSKCKNADQPSPKKIRSRGVREPPQRQNQSSALHEHRAFARARQVVTTRSVTGLTEDLFFAETKTKKANKFGKVTYSDSDVPQREPPTHHHAAMHAVSSGETKKSCVYSAGAGTSQPAPQNFSISGRRGDFFFFSFITHLPPFLRRGAAACLRQKSSSLHLTRGLSSLSARAASSAQLRHHPSGERQPRSGSQQHGPTSLIGIPLIPTPPHCKQRSRVRWQTRFHSPRRPYSLSPSLYLFTEHSR